MGNTKFWKSCMWLLVLAGLFACQDEHSFVRREQREGYTVTLFDIPDMQEDKGYLKLSELAENVRVIPMETSEKCLIGNSAGYYIGNTCILVFQRESVALFDSEGHFKRIIARYGRGPREYQQIRDYCVDEKNKMLFIIDSYNEGILKNYHLEDSACFREIKTLETIQHSAVSFLENGNLLLAPYPCERVKHLYYEQTPEGELGASTPCHSDRKGIFVSSQKLMYGVGNDFRYLSSARNFSDDTIFQVTPQGPRPMWIFQCTPIKNYRVKGETPAYLFFTFDVITKRETEKTEGGTSEYIESIRQYFVYNKNQGELWGCKGIRDDCFTGKEWSFDEIRIQSGKRFYIDVSPAALLAQTDEKPVAEAQVKNPGAWKKLLSGLKEDDNPVLIVGSL